MPNLDLAILIVGAIVALALIFDEPSRAAVVSFWRWVSKSPQPRSDVNYTITPAYVDPDSPLEQERQRMKDAALRTKANIKRARERRVA